MDNTIIKVVVNVGIGKATLELEGCPDVNMLIAHKEAFVEGLHNCGFDVQEVVTTITES